MLMDQQPSEYSYVTKQKHVKLLYVGTLANESDALHCEEPQPWLDPTKLGTLSRIAEMHAQANTDCTGALVPD